jgi:putative colanic acid biosynthesis UDP-glucose lipid carrier transferase
MSKSSPVLSFFYFLVDESVLVLAFIGSFYYYQLQHYQGLAWIILTSLSLLWLVISHIRKLYSSDLHNGVKSRLINYSKSYLIFGVSIATLIFLTAEFFIAVDKVLKTFVFAFLILDTIVNAVILFIISKLRKKRENLKHTLVAGVGDLAANISSQLKSNPDYGYEIKGFLRCNGEECKVNSKEVVGTIDDMKDYLSRHEVDEILIALPYESSGQRIQHIIHDADYEGVRVSYVPDYQGLFGTRFRYGQDGVLSPVNVRPLPLDEIYAAIEKATFDFVFSAFVLVMISPILLTIAILIKLDSPGPIFYNPVRVGRGGRNFTLYKFRTMRVNDAAVGGTLSTQKDDPRITRIGRVLRKYSLDELPQFLNVLLGDMSVVGPRPHRNFLNQQMKKHVDQYMLRYYFRPGITGWAQVNGWRGPTETEEQIAMRTNHDLWYIENWSFWLDLKIIWMTVFSRKVRDNAF